MKMNTIILIVTLIVIVCMYLESIGYIYTYSNMSTNYPTYSCYCSNGGGSYLIGNITKDQKWIEVWCDCDTKDDSKQLNHNTTDGCKMYIVANSSTGKYMYDAFICNLTLLLNL